MDKHCFLLSDKVQVNLPSFLLKSERNKYKNLPFPFTPQNMEQKTSSNDTCLADSIIASLYNSTRWSLLWVSEDLLIKQVNLFLYYLRAHERKKDQVFQRIPAKLRFNEVTRTIAIEEVTLNSLVATLKRSQSIILNKLTGLLGVVSSGKLTMADTSVTFSRPFFFCFEFFRTIFFEIFVRH